MQGKCKTKITILDLYFIPSKKIKLHSLVPVAVSKGPNSAYTGKHYAFPAYFDLC